MQTLSSPAGPLGMTKTFLDRVVISFPQQWQTIISGWITTLLVVVLAYHLAQLTWMLFPAPETDETGMSAPVEAAAKASNGISTGQRVDLAHLHLFGTAAPTAKGTTKVVTEEAPDTRLRLILRGVIAATEAEMARAIIAEPGGEEKYYAVEEKLPGGAVLKEIAPDRVILETRAGRLETLRLPKESSGGRSTRAVARAPSPRTEKRSSGRNRIIPRISAAELRGYRDKMLTNPQELVGLIRSRPVRENGQIKGYKLFPGKDRALFNRLGLRPGDVIVSVNGMDLSDPASGLALLGQLSSASEVSVVLERRGERQTVTLSLDE